MGQPKDGIDLGALLAGAGIEPERAVPARVVISSLVHDSRAVRPNSCFVAIRGSGVDGHDFIDAAVKNGAAVIVAESEVAVSRSVVLVKVSDSREALARLAAVYYGVDERGPNRLRLVGVTGTNGKSTVAWLMRSILNAAGEPTALLGTIEYDLVGRKTKGGLTTPDSLVLCQQLAEARRAGATHAVMEASSHALEQRRCDGLRFAAAAFTNLSGDHLDYHRTMWAYYLAKRRLFDLLETGAVAVINVDDGMGQRLADDFRGTLLRFGLDTQEVDVTAEVLNMTRSSTEMLVRSRSSIFPLRLPLVGRHNVLNALTAIGLSEALQIDRKAIREGIEKVGGVPGRLQRVEPDAWPFSVLVDYAHTDAALENVLTALRPVTSGRIICVFGCGGDRDRTKRPRMACVVGQLADVAIVTSDNPRSEDPEAIINEIMPGFEAGVPCRILREPDRHRAIEAAIDEACPGDCVLIAGKGHEDYQLVGDKVLHFDDAETARECLRSRMPREAVA